MEATCPELQTRHPQLRSNTAPSVPSVQPKLRTWLFQQGQWLAVLPQLSTPTPKVSGAPASSEHLSLQEPPALTTLFLSSHRGQLKVIESYFQLCFPLQSSPSLGLSWRAREQVSGMYTPATLPKVPSALGKCKHFPSPQTEPPPSFLFKMTPPTTHTLPLNLPIWHTQKLILKDLEYVFLLHR